MSSRQLFRVTFAIAVYATLIARADAQPSAKSSRTVPVRLSRVISAFLVDSGVATRGLPWTTGNTLPVKWQSAGPVTNPDFSARRLGITLARTGTFTGTIGDSVALPMTITLTGTPAGLAGMSVNIPSMEVSLKNASFATREMVEQALRNEGLSLKPLKCSRDKEGASYGNLIDAVKSPGKTASGLWWYWDSPKQEMFLTLTILYRLADMAKVECFAG